ncbi:MAG: BBP7 family outer membrane beta-barrel protein [Thermoguttaceae bacterium]
MESRPCLTVTIFLFLACAAFGQHPGGDVLFDATPNAEPALPRPTLASDPDAGGPDNGYNSLCGPDGRFWASAEALLWWVQGQKLPPLVTTFPAVTPQSETGLGDPGEVTLFGDSRANGDLRFGGRFDLGYWLDCDQTVGLEGNFFYLEGLNNSLLIGGNGDPILARPFYDAGNNNLPSSELISYPGLVNGTVQATATSGGLLGAEALLRYNLRCGCCYRLDFVGGYRYLHYSDMVGINEDLVSVDPASFVAMGTQIVVNDSFAAQNDFHSLEGGFAGEVRRGYWTLNGLAKLAVGPNLETIQINGSTTTTVPGAAPFSSSGGLLALASNIGNYHNRQWAVVPEVSTRLNYQMSSCVRAFVGYNFLYWPNVARSGNQIDLHANSNLLPPIVGPLNGPLNPAFVYHNSELWAQGITLGAEIRF